MSKEVKKNEVVKGTTNKLIEFEKTLGDSVQNRIMTLTNEGRLDLPKNYSVGNALNSAWLKILETKDRNGRPALEVSTKESIANALLEMAILGHNPAKNHGYFIVYGNKLTWFPSYFGKCAAVKRIKGIETEPIGTLIYEGDEIELGHNELGEEIVKSHVVKWQSKLKGNIVGVYATVKQGEITRSAVMTMDEVREAWLKNPGQKRDHKDFTGEFAKRTVLNRLTKTIIQTSNDDDLLAETMIENEYQHYDFEINDVEEDTKKEIATNANTGEIIDVPEEEPELEPEIMEAGVQEEKAKQQNLFDAAKGF